MKNVFFFVACLAMCVVSSCTCNRDETIGSIRGHEYVQMDANLKWATTNLGAKTPTDRGDYYAWGALSPNYESLTDPVTWKTGKSTGYSWASYPSELAYKSEGGPVFVRKYNVKEDTKDVVDNKSVLEPGDDAATMAWGGSWRMPTKEDWAALANPDNFLWEWDATNKGYTVTSRVPGYAGNKIFLPLVGGYGDLQLDLGGSAYWSSSLYDEKDKYAGPSVNAYFYFFVATGEGGLQRSYIERCKGCAVRPVSSK